MLSSSSKKMEVYKMKTYSGHKGIIFGLLWFPKSDRLVTGCNDGIIKIWNYTNGKCIMIIDTYDGEKSSSIYHMIKLNEEIFLAGYLNGRICSYDVNTGSKLKMMSTQDDYSETGRERETVYNFTQLDEDRFFVIQSTYFCLFSYKKCEKLMLQKHKGFGTECSSIICVAKIQPSAPSNIVNDDDSSRRRRFFIPTFCETFQKETKSIQVNHEIKILDLVVVVDDDADDENMINPYYYGLSEVFRVRYGHIDHSFGATLHVILDSIRSFVNLNGNEIIVAASEHAAGRNINSSDVSHELGRIDLINASTGQNIRWFSTGDEQCGLGMEVFGNEYLIQCYNSGFVRVFNVREILKFSGELRTENIDYFSKKTTARLSSKAVRDIVVIGKMSRSLDVVLTFDQHVVPEKTLGGDKNSISIDINITQEEDSSPDLFDLEKLGEQDNNILPFCIKSYRLFDILRNEQELLDLTERIEYLKDLYQLKDINFEQHELNEKKIPLTLIFKSLCTEKNFCIPKVLLLL